jgi:hypothetical protein
MDERCRYGVLVLVASLLVGQDPDVSECEEHPSHLVYVASHDNGFAVEFSVAVCPEHEAEVSQIVGYKRSIKLRSRPDAAATSPASES